MPRNPKVKTPSNLDEDLAKTLKDLRARDAERKKAYEAFQVTVVDLAPLEKAHAWLSYIAEHREADSDLESLVYLASRGGDVGSMTREVAAQWKVAEKETLESYNQQHASNITINEIATVPRVSLRDFWSGRDEQQFTIDATMLRAVERCQIGGFDHWWERLAREATEDVLMGGFEGFSGAFWLFAMCRSDYAMKNMPKALQRAFDNITIPGLGTLRPWQETIRNHKSDAAAVSDHIPCASAIVFAERRLQHNSSLAPEAIAAIQRHFDGGSWPIWTHEPTPSIEATAIAMHALAITQPRGWEHMMDAAMEYLLKAQHEDGYWEESRTPDPVYLSVLVLDAINLAAQPAGPVTFRSLSTVSGAQDSRQDAAQGQVTEHNPVLPQIETGTNRRALVDAYIEEVLQKTAKRITRADIWRKTGYKSRTEFERWERSDRRATQSAHKRFMRLLTEKPHLR